MKRIIEMSGPVLHTVLEDKEIKEETSSRERSAAILRNEKDA